MLRKLERKDTIYMLEWMHDKDIVMHLKTDFNSKTIEDCERFVENSIYDKNIHLAVVDLKDEYMGTVSLKNINDVCAEFAITMRSKALGKGLSRDAMLGIFEIAFEKYELSYVYWCVDEKNIRARKFYDKNKYKICSYNEIGSIEKYSDAEKKSYIWYIVDKEDWRKLKGEHSICDI